MLCFFSTFVMATLILFSLLWILTIDAVVASGCMEIERNALLTFKAGLVDPQNLLSSWEGKDCCKWRGVVCSNTTGHVVKLNPGNSCVILSDYICLSGEINPSLLLLTNLEHLDLSKINFNRTSIPAYLGSFKNLRYLNLSNANFNGTIPPQIGNLSKLHYLDLNSEFMYQSILQVDDILWLTRISSLKYLDMSHVSLDTATDWMHAVNMLPSLKVLRLQICSLTSISTSLSHFNLTTLNVLDLGMNFINSTLPIWLRNLTSITYLDLSVNWFHGVISDEFRYLSTLNVLILRNNDFEGMNSRALRYLCNLTTLDLSSMVFGGEIMEGEEMLPRCARNNLQTLNLRDNNLKGNLSGLLEQMNSLTYIDLGSNLLTGSIPAIVEQMNSLTYIDLGSNLLTGSILARVEQMNSLTYIDLGSNLLTGSIPAGVWKLPKLISLSLNHNSLEGVVSDVELSYLSKIQYLDLSFNSLIVRVRDDWVPPFQLQKIYLVACQMGPDFPVWLKNQSQLEILDLSRNIIVDTLPSWFWNISHLISYIDLSDNQIHGRLPLLMDSTMLSYLNLSSNQFEGPLPSLPHNLQYIDLSNNFFSGVLPNAVLPMINFLLLSNNSIGGSIPSALCESTFLEVLDLSNNNLSGEIPTCIGKSQEYLSVIDMSKNNLVGGIPDSVCSSDVSLLKFSNNGLSGEFPPLQNCTHLFILDLGYNNFSGTIPLWIGKRYLLVLLLRSNIFSGGIPMQIAQLSMLQVLDLSSNNLSGLIPRSFGNFSSHALQEDGIDIIDHIGEFYSVSVILNIKGEERAIYKILYLFESIDLSDNNLSGEIPDEITDLQTLQYLNLSGNNLIGHIPEKIGKMQSLESLDLAMNKLSGNIPQSLSALTSLSYLNLSYNNLSGVIPTGNQLQTLDNPSIYIGNQYLCGPPSSRNCSSNKTNHDDQNEGPKSKFEWLWIYFSVVLGYLSGFIVFCSVLFLNNAWRNAYFSTIDIVLDKLCKLRRRHRR